MRLTLQVCGSDGNWYLNACETKRQSCLTRRRIKPVDHARCDAAEAPLSTAPLTEAARPSKPRLSSTTTTQTMSTTTIIGMHLIAMSSRRYASHSYASHSCSHRPPTVVERLYHSGWQSGYRVCMRHALYLAVALLRICPLMCLERE